MKQTFLNLSMLAIFSTIPFSCKSINPSQGKAIYTDSSPMGNETWTRARLRPLNRYAFDLLQEYSIKRNSNGDIIEKLSRKEPLQISAEKSLLNKGVVPEKVLPLGKTGSNGKRGNYNLYISEDSDKCFFEGNFDRDIYWDSHKDQVKQQIEYVAEFLKDFHIAIDGDSNQPFVPTDIEICSASQLGNKIIWRPGGKLEIGIPYNVITGNYTPITPQELTSLWTSGAMFTSNDNLSENIKKIWPLLNPMSNWRRVIVKQLQDWSIKFGTNMSQLKGHTTDGSTTSNTNFEVVKQLSLRYVNENLLGYDRVKILTKIHDLKRLDSFINLWEEFVLSKPNQEGLLASSFTAVNEKIVVNNTAEGWLVSVANYHRVAVEGSVSTGRFSKYLKIDNPRDVNINLKCKGMIAVCTIDDISVLLKFVQNNVHFEQSLETAGFDFAAQTVLGKDFVELRN